MTKFYIAFTWIIMTHNLNVQAQANWTGKINVFIGDSNTEGVYNNSFNYGANRFASVLSSLKSSIEDNRGVSGKVVQDAETLCSTPKASEANIPTKTSDHLYLYIKLGSNDIAHHNGTFTPSDFEIRLAQLISDAQAKGWPSSNIVLLSPPWAPIGSANEPDFRGPVTGAYDVFYDYCGITNRIDEARQQAYVDAVRAVAISKNAVFIDLYTLMKNHPDRSSLISELNGGYDRIHLSATGHQFVANTLADFPYPEVLPLKLLNFEAQKETTLTRLRWRTEEEVNTKEFIVERADSRQHFESIGKVRAAANSSSQLFYEFTDYQPIPGNNLYRLRMVDSDGTYSFSKTIMVNINTKASFSLSPNPANGNVSVLSNTGTVVRLQIIDITGRILKTESLSGSVFKIDISHLKKGFYFMRFQTTGEMYTEKLLVN